MAQFIHRLLLAMAAPPGRQWISAVLSEAQALRPRERGAWYLAAAKIAFASRIKHWAPPLKAPALALIMLTVDWTSGALLPALALIALSAAMLTHGSMRRSTSALLVAGGTLPVAHAIANWVPPLRPHYQYAPLDRMDWALLAAVAGIGICAVRISAAFRAGREMTRAR